jgi:protein tyrosine/serine phosphatase
MRMLNSNTAGRDRTGVISGLLLTLAGATPDVVSLDYMLSRIGTEPVRQSLLEFALAGTNAKSPEEPGFYNLCQLREESWDAFVKRDFGGFERFVTDQLGFSDADLAKIKANLTGV